MAAYGALVSVMQIIDQLQNHPRPPISIDQKQLESLTKLIASHQKFLEGYSSHVGYTEEEDVWESRIAEAAYHAEDVIESYIVDQIHAQSRKEEENISSTQPYQGVQKVIDMWEGRITEARNDVQNISSTEFYQGVQKVTEDMNSIEIDIKEKMVVVQDQLHIVKSVSTAAVAGSSRSASSAHKVAMVGFDEVLNQMLDKITGGAWDRQIIPIVGMGGIGKTTLARNIYVSPHVKESFSVCAWSVISQEYNAREILRQVLDQVDKKDTDEEKENEGKDLGENELGDHLYKYLIGRKYFIVMDDMWNIEAWDRVRRFFPDNKNGSRIVVTTRLSNLASQFNYSNGLDLKFLDEDASWDLFCKTVFGEESCPLELDDVGKRIVRGCKGLPLSIAVIGGLLSNCEGTKESWSSFEKKLSSVVNINDDGSCLQVLYMSYNNLPVHLKPCFLYMGRYDEDEEIDISTVILVLVGEGLVKPIKGKSLEDAAEEYLNELADRNLLIVEKRKHCGKPKSCKMHDLVRDMCLREARKLKFLCVLEERIIPQGIHSQRRIRCTLPKYEYGTPLIKSLESASLVRSFFGSGLTILSSNYRLLRVPTFPKFSGVIYSEGVNLRLCVVDVKKNPIPSVSCYWNLQTLVLYNIRVGDAFEIWKMSQLRHVITYRGRLDAAYCLPDHPSGEEDMVMENLQTLNEVRNLKFGEGLLKRIPNIKTIKLYYEDTGLGKQEDDSCLNNLCCLQKLEALRLKDNSSYFAREVSFPYSLKKLTLANTNLPCEDMKTKIGWLPHLQVLKLINNAFVGSEWETCDDQFLNLKFLLIDYCDIECWITDSTHFPRLEHLHLHSIRRLREIPSCMGDIPTLQSITVQDCCASVVESAETIKEEQEELGNQDLQIIVR